MAYCPHCGEYSKSNSTKKRNFNIAPSFTTPQSRLTDSQVVTPLLQSGAFSILFCGSVATAGINPIPFFFPVWLVGYSVQASFFKNIVKALVLPVQEKEQEPTQPQETVIKHDILITEEKQNQRVSKRLPLSEKEYKVFKTIAQDVKSGVTFSGSMIAKRLKHVTQNEWSNALELMKRNGHCIKKGSGYALTRGGKVFLNSFLLDN